MKKPSQTRRSSRRERGIALLLTAASMVMVVPIVGLAIDAGFLYAVRARLSSASDAAAIAAARSLSVGLTMAEQEASAHARAVAFFDANFPDGSFNIKDKNVTVTVAETAYRTRTVFVQSSVDVGLFFMRAFGHDTTTVSAEGKASRRDVNLILVLDRSGSMDNSGSCEPMKEAAKSFVNHFANQRDRLGLITFGMTYYEAFPPSQNFKPNLTNTLSQIDCSGGTGTAQALWKGYEELESINEPGALNLILFFTDGLPNGLSADFPIKKRSDQRYGYGSGRDPYGRYYYYPSASGYYNMDPSTCADSDGDTYDRRRRDRSARYSAPNWNRYWDPPEFVSGVIAGQSSATERTGGTFGVTPTQAYSLYNHNENPIYMSGCSFSNNGWAMRRDIAYIPNHDMYGNETHGYLSVEHYWTGHEYEGRIRPDTPINIGHASKNAADNAAHRMRTDANLPAVIFTIGLGDTSGGGDPPDEVFMRRVANDPQSSVYDENQTTGLYVFAPDKTQLAQAFYRVASEILRISY